MKTFRYLFGRLFSPGLGWFSAGIVLFCFLLAVFAQPLYAYQSRDVIRLRKPGQAQLEFATDTIEDAPLVKYSRTEYLRDLTVDYAPFLRDELEGLAPDTLPPNTEDKRIPGYRDYLLLQQDVVNLQLTIAQGSSEEDYYYFLYAPNASQALGDLVRNGPANAPENWPGLLRAGQEDPSPYVRAAARNLSLRLPVRLDAFSASGLLYEMLRSTRFLLLLIPLAAWLLLADRKDRNLRRETTRLTLVRILSVFLYSAGLILATRLIVYGFLALRHGDAEGAMYVVPAWTDLLKEGVLPVYGLRDLLGLVTLLDLGFTLFITALFALLGHLTGKAVTAAATGSLLLLLPAALARPVNLAAGLVTPFQYLFWDLRTNTRAGEATQVEDAFSLFPAAPGQVMALLLLGSLVLLVLIPGAIGLERRLRSVREDRRRRQARAGTRPRQI